MKTSPITKYTKGNPRVNLDLIHRMYWTIKAIPFQITAEAWLNNLLDLYPEHYPVPVSRKIYKDFFKYLPLLVEVYKIHSKVVDSVTYYSFSESYKRVNSHQFYYPVPNRQMDKFELKVVDKSSVKWLHNYWHESVVGYIIFTFKRPYHKNNPCVLESVYCGQTYDNPQRFDRHPHLSDWDNSPKVVLMVRAKFKDLDLPDVLEGFLSNLMRSAGLPLQNQHPAPERVEHYYRRNDGLKEEVLQLTELVKELIDVKIPVLVKGQKLFLPNKRAQKERKNARS